MVVPIWGLHRFRCSSRFSFWRWDCATEAGWGCATEAMCLSERPRSRLADSAVLSDGSFTLASPLLQTRARSAHGRRDRQGWEHPASRPVFHPRHDGPTFSDGVHAQSLALLGQYVASSFSMASDGHAGTPIADPALTQQSQLTLPHA